jgi:hypothetical protein
VFFYLMNKLTGEKVMAKAILEAGESYIAASNVTIFGSSGSETVKVRDGAVITTDPSIERVEFTKASTDLSFKATSTGIQVLFGTTVIANVATGEKLAFADGSASVSTTFNPSTGVSFKIGDGVVSTTSGKVSFTLNTGTGEASTIATGTSGIVTISGAGTKTATTGADTYKLAAATSSYEVTISGGFNYASDKILVPTGSTTPSAIASTTNNVTDGKVDLTWASNGNLITIHLIGVDATTEAALQANAVASVFGTY